MKDRLQSSSTRKKVSKHSRVKKTGPRWTKDAVLRELKEVADPRVREKMAYFGVNVPKACGISTPVLHSFAKHIGKDHQLAEQLWQSEIHEARILASLLGEPQKVTSAQMDRWARDFNSWDVVEASCCYLFASA